jgi:hypothetical protein
MNDLNSLLRDHVERTEPILPPDLGPCLARGRRKLRRRRVAVAAGALGAVALVGAITVPAMIHGDPPGRGHVIDPATSRALADYDPQAMPQILEDHVSAVLERSVTDLPKPTFGAYDDQGRPLDVADYGRASGMSITYGAGTGHRWSVSIGHSRSDAEGDARRNCANDVRTGTYLRCEVSVSATGDVVISRLTALRPMPGPRGSAAGWVVVNADRLDRANPASLWFSQDVKVVHSETFLTYAEEIVKAPALADAEQLFEVPVDDLVEIGTDPELVIPEPPASD